MSQRKKSKEERFMEKIYEFAGASGDPENEVDRYKVGASVGENPKGTDHTVQRLAKINFIKKSGDKLIYLTQAGLTFVANNISD